MMTAKVQNPDLMEETPKEKKSRFRLSNPFKDKDKDVVDSETQLQAIDSAYGGSETDTSPNTSSQAVPTITQHQADAQGAPLEHHTDSRGRVVTTTVTTVTTTTTTTSGDSYDIPPGKQVVVANEKRTTTGPTELNGTPVTAEDARQHPPNIPAKNRARSPHNGMLAPQHALKTGAESSSPTSPTHQSIAHNAQVEEPTSPGGHQNFSYPGRQGLSPTGMERKSYTDMHNPTMNTGRPRPPVEPSYGQPPSHEPPSRYPPPLSTTHHTPYEPEAYENSPLHGQPPAHGLPPYGQRPPASGQVLSHSPLSHQGSASSLGSTPGYPPRQSTAQSIRTAAAGIHGAGEALRGALNSKVARTTGGTPEEIARHNAVIERGRTEIETGRFYHLPSVPEVQTPPTDQLDSADRSKKSKGLRNMLRKDKSRERMI